MASRRLWVKRRRTPRWAILLSWIVGAVIWVTLINDLTLQDLPETGALINADAEQLLNGLYFVVVATAVAAFAMYFVRLIGRAWLNLRS